MLQKLEEVRKLLSGDLDYSKRTQAKEIVDNLLSQSASHKDTPHVFFGTEHLESQDVRMKVHADRIRRSIDCLAVGRKTLVVSEDKQFHPSKPMTVYAPDNKDGIIPTMKKPDNFLMGEAIDPHPIEISGSFEVAAAPVRAGNEDVLNMYGVRAREEYDAQETEHILKALAGIACFSGLSANQSHHLVSYRDAVNPGIMQSCFGMISEHGGIALKLIAHPTDISDILINWSCSDESTVRERITCNLSGHLWTADMHSSRVVRPKTFMLTDMPDRVGQLLILEPFKVSITEKSERVMEYSYSSTIAIGLYSNSCVILETK